MKSSNNKVVAQAIDKLNQEAKLCGMSLSDVCVLLGMSQSYVRQLRHMLFNAKDETVEKINLATNFLHEHGAEFKEKYSKEALMSEKYYFLTKLKEEFYASNDFIK